MGRDLEILLARDRRCSETQLVHKGGKVREVHAEY